MTPVRLAARIAERFSAGRLEERMKVQGEDDLARLAMSFNTMAANLKGQIRQLEDLSRLQRRFTSDVSHELRTPLTTVRMAGDVIYEARPDFDPATARAAELLHEQLDRFEALLTDLLEISRFDAGAAVLEAEPVDLRTLVASVRSRTHSRSRIDAAALWSVTCPSRRAWPRSTRGAFIGSCATWSSTRSSTAKAQPVEVHVVADDVAVAVGVRDHGVGLRPGESSLVFNRFWRADPARARTTGGTGLGLAIAYEDARLHGGWLEAWGAPGDGAQFRLTVPVGGRSLDGFAVAVAAARRRAATSRAAQRRRSRIARSLRPVRTRSRRAGSRGPTMTSRAARRRLSVASRVIVLLVAAAAARLRNDPDHECAERGLGAADRGCGPIRSGDRASTAAGASPTEVVSGFLDASAAFEDNWAIARTYLAPDVGEAVATGNTGVSVYDAGTSFALTPETSEDHSAVSVVMRAPNVASISSTGSYSLLRSAHTLGGVSDASHRRAVADRGGTDRSLAVHVRCVSQLPGVQRLLPGHQPIRARSRSGLPAHPKPRPGGRSRSEPAAGPSAGLAPAVSTGIPSGTALATSSVPYRQWHRSGGPHQTGL